MQTFLPFPDFKKTFQVLDYRRLGKQRAEALTLIHVIEGIKPNGTKPKGWLNHPITIMWKSFLNALKLYHNYAIEEWVQRGYNNSMDLFIIDKNNIEFPDWLGYEPFHASHRANLLRKDFEFYNKYGWIENPNNPYLWRDSEKRWYTYNLEKKEREYKLK